MRPDPERKNGEPWHRNIRHQDTAFTPAAASFTIVRTPVKVCDLEQVVQFLAQAADDKDAAFVAALLVQRDECAQTDRREHRDGREVHGEIRQPAVSPPLTVPAEQWELPAHQPFHR